MHAQATVTEVLALSAAGLSPTQISYRTGIARSTIREWVTGVLPRSFAPDRRGCERCGAEAHAFDDLPAHYVYLLGLYLGDGWISRCPRGVFKLRIAMDAKYPIIVDECRAAIAAVMPRNAVNLRRRLDNCVEIYAHSKSWPCLFPQHGPGKKHERVIRLTSWQSRMASTYPELLLRGLVHSDGCRFQNSGRNWSSPRYGFRNKSCDIRKIFCAACDDLQVRCTHSGEDTVYVSRKADVSRLDRFIGPKR